MPTLTVSVFYWLYDLLTFYSVYAIIYTNASNDAVRATKGTQLEILHLARMATYEPYGLYSILEWISFGLALLISFVLFDKASDRFGKARWYRRESGRRDKVVIATEQSGKGFTYLMLAFGALSIAIWYTLPYPLSELLNLVVPLSFALRLALLALAGLSLVIAIICKAVAGVKNRKINHSTPMGTTPFPETGAP